MITVAIPAYKTKFLERAIRSVLSQTYADFELIVFADGPPEEIKSVITQFHDKRIRFYINDIEIENRELAKTWNKCLSLARGEYFVLFSDDDIYHPDFLSEMIKLAQKYPLTNVFHCRVREIDEMENTLTYSPLCSEWEDVFDFIWHRLKIFRNQYAPDFFCRTSKLKQIGGFVSFPLAWGSDDATWFSLSKNGGIGYSNKVLFEWRNSSINISNVGRYEDRLRAIVDYTKWLNDFVNRLSFNSDKDKDLQREIERLIPKWIEVAEKAVLLRILNGFNDSWRLIYIWVRYSRKYKIRFETLLKTFFSLIKSSESF